MELDRRTLVWRVHLHVVSILYRSNLSDENASIHLEQKFSSFIDTLILLACLLASVANNLEEKRGTPEDAQTTRNDQLIVTSRAAVINSNLYDIK
jgi:hypothetical protein